MNFLAHDAVLAGGAPALLRVATALPDLFRLLPTPPLPLLLVRALRRRGTDEALTVARGIRAHLIADATFHRHPLFLARVERLAGELARLWPGLDEPELAAHILVEMLLDQWVLRQDPSRAARFAGAFTPLAVASVAHHGADDEPSRVALGRILGALGGSTFEQDYASAGRFALRFERAWGRSGFVTSAVPCEALAERVGRWSEELAPGSSALLAAVAAAVAEEALREPGLAAP